jgi:hypothetical protein
MYFRDLTYGPDGSTYSSKQVPTGGGRRASTTPSYTEFKIALPQNVRDKQEEESVA